MKEFKKELIKLCDTHDIEIQAIENYGISKIAVIKNKLSYEEWITVDGESIQSN